jgi:hypothetical protein
MSLIFGIVFFLLTLPIGLFLFLNPHQALEIQKRFYAAINWRIEPISLSKEIRNTRIIGLFLIFVSLLAAPFFL